MCLKLSHESKGFKYCYKPIHSMGIRSSSRLKFKLLIEFFNSVFFYSVNTFLFRFKNKCTLLKQAHALRTLLNHTLYRENWVLQGYTLRGMIKKFSAQYT